MFGKSAESGSSQKYLATLNIEVKGIVEPSDVIGAVFGQVEGLLGPELDLRELQQAGKIGRIAVKLKRKNNRSVGTIELRSNLDKIRTSLLCAAVEIVEKVGPYAASITLEKTEDIREKERERIRERAVTIFNEWSAKSEESYQDIVKDVLKEAAGAKLTRFGTKKLPAGTGVESSEEIIVVEGRADVNNLLRYGFSYAIAIGGAIEKIPKDLVKLVSKKDTIVFVDGDRGGDMVLRSLLEQTDVDYVARAPEGRSVENLSAKEIRKALSSAVSADEVRTTLGLKPEKKASPKGGPESKPGKMPTALRPHYVGIEGTSEALLLDKGLEAIAKVPVNTLYDALDDHKGIEYVIYDRVVTQRLIEKAYSAGVRMIVGAKLHDVTKIPAGIRVLTAK